MATTVTGASLHDQVYEELRGRLLTRRHVPGAKLSLHELAAELGVSRSPVHHALTRLVSEGLLTVKARRGYFVTPVTAGALAEGYEVRLALELHAAERAVGRLDAGDLGTFRSLLEATADAISHEQWDGANAAFHEHQIDLAGNALLSRFYRELSVNLMMQVIRGGHLEDHAGSSPSTGGSSRPSRRAISTPRGARSARTSRPASGSPSRRSSAPAASFDRGGTHGSLARGTHGSPASPLLLGSAQLNRTWPPAGRSPAPAADVSAWNTCCGPVEGRTMRKWQPPRIAG